jgi:hypothetical protein
MNWISHPMIESISLSSLLSQVNFVLEALSPSMSHFNARVSFRHHYGRMWETDSHEEALEALKLNPRRKTGGGTLTHLGSSPGVT